VLRKAATKSVRFIVIDSATGNITRVTRPVPKIQAPAGYLKNAVMALSSDSLFLASGSTLNLINLRTFRPRVIKFN
jgi:hypothetical protein